MAGPGQASLCPLGVWDLLGKGRHSLQTWGSIWKYCMCGPTVHQPGLTHHTAAGTLSVHLVSSHGRGPSAQYLKKHKFVWLGVCPLRAKPVAQLLTHGQTGVPVLSGGLSTRAPANT